MGLEELIKKCKNGDILAQGQLYKQYASQLYGACLKYAPNATEAQDVLQDAFLTIYDKIGQYKHKGSFEGWMKRIAVNTALQRYRAPQLYRMDDNWEVPDAPVVEATEDIPLDFLLTCVQELPDRYRLVFNLYVLDGYTHKEIGKLLSISDGTSKSNLSRARILLKQKVEAWTSQDEAGAV